MKKIIEFLKKNAIGFILGALASLCIASVAASGILSADMAYTNEDHPNITNVEDALNDLYSRGTSGGGNYSYNFNIMLETEENSDVYETGTYEQLQAGDYNFNTSMSYCDDGTNQSSVTLASTFSFQPNKTTCYLYYYAGLSFADYIIELASTNEHIYHHTSDTTASDYVANNARDDSYRYAGPNSTVEDNYVCFGYNRATAADSNSNSIPDVCESGTFSATSDYAYRIIGVFKDVDGNSNDAYYVKLIKATSYGSYHWDYESSTSSNRSNIFANSELFKKTLNGSSSSYLATLNSNGWSNYLAQPKWYVGGNTWTNIGDKQASGAYAYERTDTNTVNTTYKIGLMYPSDYGFAISNSYWTTALGSYSSAAADQDWLKLGSYEWTISRKSDTNYAAYQVTSGGTVGVTNAVQVSCVVRPVLYLSSSVIATGSGTIESPYILSM